MSLLTLYADRRLVYNIEIESNRLHRVRFRGLLVSNAPILPEGMVLRSRATDKDYFLAEDRENAAFFIKGSLTAGRLSFAVVAVVDGQRGPSALTGRQFFDAMMAHFGTRRVKVIFAEWSNARPGLKTNLDLFNLETRNGVANQNAAFRTKTGQWVRDYNFKAIRSLETTPNAFPGGYEPVLVEFVRPARVARTKTREEPR